MKEEDIKFSYLRTYASFLVNHQLQPLMDFSLAYIKKENTPFVTHFLANNNEEVFCAYWKENFVSNILQYLTQDHPLAVITRQIHQWKGKQLLQPTFEVYLEDIIAINNTQKQTLLEFIPAYTADVQVTLLIVKELENCFRWILQHTLQAYDAINRSKLAEKENVLNGLLANIPIIVTRLDANGNIRETAGKGLQLLALTPNELKDKNIFTLFPESPNIEKVINERISVSFESQVSLERKILHFQNYFYPEGEDSIMGFSIDITARKIAEQELKETQHYISQVAYTSPDTLYIYNLQQNRIVYLNRDTSETLGYSTNEIYALGSNIIDTLVHPDETQGFREHFRLFISAKDKEVRETEFRFRNKQWQWRHLLTRETVFKRTPEGVPYEIIGILRDITEQKEAEEEIRYKTRLLDKLLYNFPISIGVIDKNGTFLESRGLGIRKFGSHDNQIAGWNVFESFPSMAEPVRKILAGETIEFTGHTDYNGRLIYYRNYGFFDQEKNCAIILAVEITEIKEASEKLRKLNEELELKVWERTKELAASEEELRHTLDRTIELNKQIAASENFLSSIIDQSPVSTWISDVNGTLIRANQACINLFGTQYDAQGVEKYNIFQDKILQNSPYFQEIQAVFTEGKVAKFAGDYTLSKASDVNIPTDNTISVVTTIFPIKNENGKVVNAVIQHEDVTQRKRALEALQQSETQLRLITDSLPVLITYIDQDERYRFNNRSYEEWFGIAREKVYGQRVKEVIGEPAYNKIKDYMHMALRGQEVSFEAELPYKFGLKYVAIDYVPHYEKEKVVGIYALVTDISERKRTETAIETALQETETKNQELIKINQLLDNFVYMAAHDLKSPVSNIKVLIGLLGNETDPTQKPELMAAVLESINRLDNTIEGLVEVIEIQSINNIPTKSVNFQHILDEIVADTGNDLEKCHGNIIADFSLAPSVNYIETFLRSIMRNLVTNAIKYHSPSRNLEIRITARREAEFVVLTVADNGIGMDLTRYGQHLYKPFTRFTNKARGKGLGLHLVKTMVEKNGGLIKVESKIDKGTQFEIFLKEY